MRNDFRQPSFEPLPRHDAMLDGKNSEQRCINDQRLGKRRFRTRIHRLRNCDVTDETNRIQKRSEENQIANDPVHKYSYSRHTTSWFALGAATYIYAQTVLEEETYRIAGN